MRSAEFRLAQFHVATVIALASLSLTIVEALGIACSLVGLLLCHSRVRTFSRLTLARAESSAVTWFVAIVAATARAIVETVELSDVAAACSAPGEPADVVKFALLATEVDVARNGLNFGRIASACLGGGGLGEDHHFVGWAQSSVARNRVQFGPNIVNLGEGHEVQCHRSGKEVDVFIL